MNKKDIDFGLKDIKIDDYKLKKNNSGKLISIIIITAVIIFYYQYSSKELVDQIDSSNFKSLNNVEQNDNNLTKDTLVCLLYTSPSPRDTRSSRMPSSA